MALTLYSLTGLTRMKTTVSVILDPTDMISRSILVILRFMALTWYSLTPIRPGSWKSQRISGWGWPSTSQLRVTLEPTSASMFWGRVRNVGGSEDEWGYQKTLEYIGAIVFFIGILQNLELTITTQCAVTFILQKTKRIQMTFGMKFVYTLD